MITPSVITSNKAREDVLKIRSQHDQLVRGLSQQQERLTSLNQQKQSELQNEQTVKADLDKSKMLANTTAQKNALDFATKQAEIDIKRSAIASKL